MTKNNACISCAIEDVVESPTPAGYKIETTPYIVVWDMHGNKYKLKLNQNWVRLFGGYYLVDHLESRPGCHTISVTNGHEKLIIEVEEIILI